MKHLAGLVIVVIGTAVAWRFSVVPRHVPVVDTEGWHTFQDVTDRFSFQYPTEFRVLAGRGHSDLERDFSYVEIGAPSYLNELAKPTQGSGGLPLYLRLTVSQRESNPRRDLESVCGERKLADKFEISGRPAAKCESVTMGGHPSVWIVVFHEDAEYVFSSDMYVGEDKLIIDQIISSFTFNGKG